MRHHPKVAALVCSVLLGIVLSFVGASPAPAFTWAPASTATIHPGVQMVTDGAQCTANFIFTDASNVYIGYAAHCAGTGGATDTNGCEAGSLPLGTPVDIQGAAQDGTLVYSSWHTMDVVDETDENTCQYNDLALVRIAASDIGKVNPSIPHWGGPVGLNTTGAPFGSRVYTYGNSSLRFGVTTLSPKTGTSNGTTADGWSHPVYTATPGIPGDSGSALLDSQGRALGVLSTVAIAPFPGENGFGDLAHELAYMRAHTTLDAQLVNGTQPFNGSQAPVGGIRLPVL